MTAGKTLAWGLTALRIDLASEAQVRLMQYAALIQKWNRMYNLTAVREEEGIVTHHLLDSLAVSPHIGAGAMVDVGSGAGLPGIPLAIARPERSVTLLEASQKKAAFLRQAIIELALNNASVACERVETWHVAARFDIVVSRAFSDLRRFVELAGRLCGPQGIIAAMRGRYKREDSALLPDPFRVRKVITLEVPGLDAERHLVLIAREA